MVVITVPSRKHSNQSQNKQGVSSNETTQ